MMRMVTTAMKNKKSRKYWQQRFEQIENSSNKIAFKVAQETDVMFQDAEKEIEEQISVWYQRFATNNNISIEDARKWLKSDELKELQWTIQEYIKYGEENSLNPRWMKELENASAKYHISRLEALKLQTRQTIEALYNNEEKVINTMVQRVYSDGYYHAMYEIQKGFNIGWDIESIDQRKLQMIVSKPWSTDGKNFSDRIWQSKAQLIESLHSELTRSCILGKSPDEAIRKIAKKFNTSKAQAGRLIMTEQAYFSSVAQKDVFNELDVEQYEIVATLDNRTSEVCQDMDGHIFYMKDYVEGVTAPPFHPNCRTTTVPYFDDEFNLGERAAKDEDGKTYYVSSDMTYKDWKQSVVEGDSGNLQPHKENQLLSFEEESALMNYISSDSYKINDLLRKKLELPEQYENMKNNLDNALNKMNNYEGTAYRVLDIYDKDLLDAFIKRNEVGKPITFSEYLSFSSEKGYNDDGNVFIFTNSNKAKDVRQYNPDEHEVLYQRNSTFIVKRVVEKDGKYFILWGDINE